MESPPDPTPLLEVMDLVKDYGSGNVLKQMNLTLRRGEVRALMGVNGAGKSTLVKILGGVVQPTAGALRLEGADYHPQNPGEGSDAGVAIVHQELSLVPGLSVAENITLGQWPMRSFGPLSVVSVKAMRARAQRALEKLGEEIPLGLKVSSLSPAKQQLVEIAKALLSDPKVLILDEPTSSLAAHEANQLLGTVRRLATGGVAIVYVSHRMDEIPRVADTVTVMRDGREVATDGIDSMGTGRIAELMLGAEVASRPEAAEVSLGPKVLEVDGLSRPGVIENATFSVRAGEVVGIVGLMGAGRTEILRAIFGLDPAEGSVSVHGKAMSHRTPRSMIGAGVGFTPEDRKGQGLVLGLSVTENLVMTCYDLIRSRFGTLSRGKQAEMARHSIAQQGISTPSAATLAGRLSGGNQQKIVIGKWINRGADILLMDEPTRGVDVHAKSQTYDAITARARAGAAVVFVSSEVEEVFLVCQRVLIVRAGRIVAERQIEDTTAQEVLALSMKEVNAA
ncbi:sugar ABC transporter ATP-binding protein [Ruania zhangjianzhongii]|uniref:sugar ABC transporter ATP-binding protein n=1 Tax=Ruania zhangjianzhongii TaxID=2603206 RepID=UPI0011CA54A9|nr:sugar ABC transporter ATP-binding protein [Ruania zhangjianzhongii]